MARVVTIDGPAGVGKSTASRGLAARLGWLHLDSGSLYRAVAWNARRLALDACVPGDRRRATEDLAASMRLLRNPSGDTEISIDGVLPGSGLRTEEIGREASIVASDATIRDLLLPVQRACAGSDVVAEGRDMGTVVFPDAIAKFFLTADPEVRAVRRYRELEGTPRARELPDIRRDMEDRDRRDETRQVSPLRPADDAIVVDTSAMGVEEVLDIMEGHLRSRIGR